MSATAVLKIFRTKESQQWPKDLTQLEQWMDRADADKTLSRDEERFWGNPLPPSIWQLPDPDLREYRHQLVDAFVEESFRFSDLAVETKFEPVIFEGREYQAVVKRLRTDEKPVILVAIIDVSPVRASFIFNSFCEGERCNPTGVIGALVVDGIARFEFHYRPTDPLHPLETTFGKKFRKLRLPITLFLRGKLQLVEEGKTDEEVEKLIEKVKAFVMGEAPAVPGLAEKLSRHLYITL
ncbi:hypothetical protein SCHPADRAFT_885025 [Schizopora paradoxa]|uniref:Uncharacterized protein n=1 Tax=Schizopora paradoxa TaxID=27342 RepID=A0A0H2S692_9AGAM|nr:hypothetical protein SCHPADRAFT_885025 [Schizopora paradoxa]